MGSRGVVGKVWFVRLALWGLIMTCVGGTDGSSAEVSSGALEGSERPARMLPAPHAHLQPDDPEWLPMVVQLHGHLGPWVVLGVRSGAAARQALGAEGYFDIEVVCRGPFAAPPAACFLDGVQLSTGATWGKGNISWEPAKEVAVVMTHRLSGRKVVVRPRPEIVAEIRKVATRPIASTGKRTSPGQGREEEGSSAAPAAAGQSSRASERSEREPGKAQPAHRHSDHLAPPPAVEALARQLARLPAEELLFLEYLP
jgi:formylmethanofuran dehydrogenase subunit E